MEVGAQHAPVVAGHSGFSNSGFDVLSCPRCGGRLRLIALIEEAAVIGRILRHLGVPTQVPAPRLARAPLFPAGTPDRTGWDDDTSVFNSCS